MPQITLVFLESALARLKEILQRMEAAEKINDMDSASIFRTAAIQAFEYTYELAWKAIRRFLEVSTADHETYHTMIFADLIRTASDQGLIKNDWAKWKDYRDQRNRTSHTYKEATAIDVMHIMPDFTVEIEYLIAQLKPRITALTEQ